LIHEVAIACPELIQKSAVARQILGYHTTPEEAGKIFSIVKPRLAIYSHIALVLTDPTIPPPTIDDLLPRTKLNYSGTVEIGEDLMTIEIGDKITVTRFLNDKK
jgi:ribonuclease Z